MDLTTKLPHIDLPKVELPHVDLSSLDPRNLDVPHPHPLAALHEHLDPTLRRWRRRRKVAVVSGALVAGAAAAYFLDPVSGSQRRAQARMYLWGEIGFEPGDAAVPPLRA